MTVDRGTTWPVQYGAHERLILRTQSKWDRRHLRPRWYWRLLTDEDEPGGTAQDPAYGEAIRAHRRYADPIPVHIYLDPTGRQKGMKRGRVDTEGNGSYGWSRAEARRVGALLGTLDDVAVTPSGSSAQSPGDQVMFTPGVDEDELLYIPRPGDIFLHTRKLWELQQATHQDLGATDIVVVWAGTAALFADDVVDPLEYNLPLPSSPVPPDIRTPSELR